MGVGQCPVVVISHPDGSCALSHPSLPTRFVCHGHGHPWFVKAMFVGQRRQFYGQSCSSQMLDR